MIKKPIVGVTILLYVVFQRLQMEIMQVAVM